MSSLYTYPGFELLLHDIVRAENCHVYDAQDRRWVDLESGVWCTPLGHTHPRVVRALVEQASRIAHTGYAYTCAVVEEAAREVLGLLGLDGGRCVFLCSGSEAIEYGVRIAQAVLERPLLMTMSDSYFGAYGSAQRRHQDEWFSFDWLPCGDCQADETCGATCPRFAAIPFERIGGFLFEPGSSSGLVRFPPQKLIASIARAVTEADGLILVNEVTTGIGRTGRWFGFEHYGLAPDIVALGKGLGNGYPVAVTAVAPAAAARLGERTIKYAQSHQNDPLGAAVAREVLRTIREENWIERGREMGALLLEGLEAIKAQSGRIRDLRARGLMLAVELEGDAETALEAQRELVRRGFIVARRPGLSVLRIDPALTVERADVEAFLATFEEVLREIPAAS